MSRLCVVARASACLCASALVHSLRAVGRPLARRAPSPRRMVLVPRHERPEGGEQLDASRALLWRPAVCGGSLRGGGGQRGHTWPCTHEDSNGALSHCRRRVASKEQGAELLARPESLSPCVHTSEVLVHGAGLSRGEWHAPEGCLRGVPPPRGPAGARDRSERRANEHQRGCTRHAQMARSVRWPLLPPASRAAPRAVRRV